MCARSTSDLFSVAPRLYGESLGPHQVDSERRHLLPTQHAQQGQGGCAGCLRGERRRERRSVFVSATSSVAGMPWGNTSFVFALCKSLFYPEADVLINQVLGIATYNQLFFLARSIARSITSLWGSMAFSSWSKLPCNRVRIIHTVHVCIQALICCFSVIRLYLLYS